MMRKFTKTHLSVIIVFALCLASCGKKDSPPPPPPPDNKTLLTNKTWYIKHVGTDNNKDGKIEDGEFSAVPASVFLYMTFLYEGTLKQEFGASSPDYRFSWQLSDSKTIKLVIQASGKTGGHYTIRTLTADQFDFDIYGDNNTTLQQAYKCVPK